MSIHGELYDLTEFAARHPGGALPLRLAAGGDATDLFEMYHTGPHARQVLHQYRVNPSLVEFVAGSVRWVATLAKG